MNADLSVAPELAQLLGSPGTYGGAGSSPAPAGPGGSSPRTSTSIGRRAGELARLAAAPQRWWDLVRFDPDGPVRIPVPGPEGAWLLILPPGATAECDCGYVTLLAGEAAEARPLHAGRVRVRGRRPARPAAANRAGSNQPGHRIRGAGHGFSVTLHAADGPVRSEDPNLYPERTVATVHAPAVPPEV